MTNLIDVKYNQTGKSKHTNSLGMREMQQRVYEKRDNKYILLKAPPASGKSRALMFVALDKLLHQGLKKVIVAVPEKSIGGSFLTTNLSDGGFESDWEIDEKYNLCTIESNEKKGTIFKEFLTNDKKILVCTHSTLRGAFETIDDKKFDDILLAIDEFHHLSASDDNVLGNVMRNIIANSSAHIFAMTGSYFRGDSHPILLAETEELFTKVTYNYYEQLNGYEYLQTLGIGYHFYQGKYLESIDEVLDTDKKTIIHIPHTNSRESTDFDKCDEVGYILGLIGDSWEDDKETGIIKVTRKSDGRVFKVADLVDDNANRDATQKYLRDIKQADDMDIIIAMGMAQEGFDWVYCEHALTVGYRASLTQIVQIIGRATRDNKGKDHAQFTNLISVPDATDQSVQDATNDMLKAITASLLMEQVLAPNFKFKTKLPNDDTPNKAGEFKIKGLKEPTTKRVKDILAEDLVELKEKIISDATVEKTLGADISPEVINKSLIPKIIEESYPNYIDEEKEVIRQHLVVDSVLKSVDIDMKKNQIFVKNTGKFINIDDLHIDLIDQINPFQKAYEILSKSIDKKVLKLIQDNIDVNRSTIDEVKAEFYWKDVNKFVKEKGREPDKNSKDEVEKNLAEVLAFVRLFKRKQKNDR